MLFQTTTGTQCHHTTPVQNVYIGEGREHAQEDESVYSDSSNGLIKSPSIYSRLLTHQEEFSPSYATVRGWFNNTALCAHGSSSNSSVQSVLPASLGHQTSGLITGSVSQGQGQGQDEDHASLHSTSHASYTSYDMEDTTEAPAEVYCHDQAQINC